ncbi:hypothetical protein QN239_32405 [Mycolicibacterium sp. Y3]
MSDSPWSPAGADTPGEAPHHPYEYPVSPPWPATPAPWPPPTSWHPSAAPAPRQRNGWLIACMVTIAVVISLGFIAPFAFAAFLTAHVEDSVENVTGAKTSDILANNLDVTFGGYTPRRDSYTESGKLNVTFKNKGAERASFDVTIEAVDDQGRRIEEITAYADDLAPGQSFTKSVLVLPDDAQSAAQLPHATFQLLSVSMR